MNWRFIRKFRRSMTGLPFANPGALDCAAGSRPWLPVGGRSMACRKASTAESPCLGRCENWRVACNGSKSKGIEDVSCTRSPASACQIHQAVLIITVVISHHCRSGQQAVWIWQQARSRLMESQRGASATSSQVKMSLRWHAYHPRSPHRSGRASPPLQ